MKMKLKKLLCILLTAAMVVPMAITAYSADSTSENVKTVIPVTDAAGINLNGGKAYLDDNLVWVLAAVATLVVVHVVVSKVVMKGKPT